MTKLKETISFSQLSKNVLETDRHAGKCVSKEKAAKKIKLRNMLMAYDSRLIQKQNINCGQTNCKCSSVESLHNEYLFSTPRALAGTAEKSVRIPYKGIYLRFPRHAVIYILLRRFKETNDCMYMVTNYLSRRGRKLLVAA